MTIVTTTDEHELLIEISNAEKVVASKEAIVNDLKEQMKEAKEEYEVAVDKLRRLCRQQENDADRPLLKDDGGIESVTLSVPGTQSVTLKPKDFEKIANNAKKSLRNKR